MVFGKKKISEIEAAGQFVLTISKSVQLHWPEIAKELNSMLEAEDSISGDEYAGFEFLVAVIASQIQALPNLVTGDQASRIRDYVIQCMSSPEVGDYPRGAIQFKRGRRLWNLLGIGRETWLAHTIEIAVKPSEVEGCTVRISYLFPGRAIRFRPYQTEREISELVANLGSK